MRFHDVFTHNLHKGDHARRIREDHAVQNIELLRAFRKLACGQDGVVRLFSDLVNRELLI